MPYTNPDTMMEVANILDDFDEESLLEIFKSQIIGDPDLFTSLPVNHFQPLYLSYTNAVNLQNSNEDDIDLIRMRFQNICISIIDLICAKHNLTIDDDWLNSNFSRLPAVTLGLYHFFVLDTFYIYLEVLNNYILKNLDSLSNIFSEMINKKDASTINNKATMDPKYAIIASAIYDVTDYIFTMLDNEDFFSYMDNAYMPGRMCNELFDNFILGGDLVNSFGNIYKENVNLRSKISFELIYQMKTHGELKLITKLKDNEVDVDPNLYISEDSLDDDSPKLQNTSIDDDVDED